MKDSQQTVTSFRDKWTNNPGLAFSETLNEDSDIFQWILRRNGLSSPDALREWLRGRARVLDGGCGNGRVTALLRRYAPPETEIVGVDIAAADVARENLKELENVRIEAGDLLGDLSGLGPFDLIYSQEVLHHTADPRGAFLNLASRLSAGGELAVYVYKRKAPMREYADDYIRDRSSQLPYEEAMTQMKGLAELGRALSALETNVAVPDIPVLGIKAGEYDVQRFVYHFFLKCFWNPSLSMADNVAINYDWYHPQLSTRHTVEEVHEWVDAAGLRLIHSHVDEYGITVRAVSG